MGLRDEARSLVTEAWAGAKPHVTMALRNAMVYGAYFLIMFFTDVLTALHMPSGLAGKLVVGVVSFGELSFLVLFLVMSIISEVRGMIR